MPYGSETHDEYLTYNLVLQHIPTTVELNISVFMTRPDNTVPSEATRDQIFQAFLNKLNELANTDIISANKKGNFLVPITPA